ncbi:SPOSA6832_00708 [Sporobolomyces salmonicolor]|uniref:SPOSA6832_00708-mRNA-1:cds n=1 Tax=Sporidiobolus salmonicolor TaxID=5005 RepID=A0A0D6EGX0_SPOSA|nr:SPOSA6832_00708 [Sporobolomyces salmonicolor]
MPALRGTKRPASFTTDPDPPNSHQLHSSKRLKPNSPPPLDSAATTTAGSSWIKPWDLLWQGVHVLLAANSQPGPPSLSWSRTRVKPNTPTLTAAPPGQQFLHQHKQAANLSALPHPTRVSSPDLNPSSQTALLPPPLRSTRPSRPLRTPISTPSSNRLKTSGSGHACSPKVRAKRSPRNPPSSGSSRPLRRRGVGRPSTAEGTSSGLHREARWSTVLRRGAARTKASTGGSDPWGASRFVQPSVQPALAHSAIRSAGFDGVFNPGDTPELTFADPSSLPCHATSENHFSYTACQTRAHCVLPRLSVSHFTACNRTATFALSQTTLGTASFRLASRVASIGVSVVGSIGVSVFGFLDSAVFFFVCLYSSTLSPEPAPIPSPPPRSVDARTEEERQRDELRLYRLGVDRLKQNLDKFEPSPLVPVSCSAASDSLRKHKPVVTTSSLLAPPTTSYASVVASASKSPRPTAYSNGTPSRSRPISRLSSSVDRALQTYKATLTESPVKALASQPDLLENYERLRAALEEAELSAADLDVSSSAKVQKRRVWPKKLPKQLQDRLDTIMRDRKFEKFLPGASVDADALRRLKGLTWLNDDIVVYYGVMINRRLADAEKKGDLGQGETRLKKSYAMNSHWWTMYGDHGYARVKKWTKKVRPFPSSSHSSLAERLMRLWRQFDVFAKDIIIFPVNLNNSHWSCAAINLEKKRFEYYDSFGGELKLVYKRLRKWLTEEHAEKKKAPLDLSDWTDHWDTSTPQQGNSSDCGVFTVRFLSPLSLFLDVTDGVDESSARLWSRCRVGSKGSISRRRTCLSAFPSLALCSCPHHPPKLTDLPNASLRGKIALEIDKQELMPIEEWK